MTTEAGKKLLAALGDLGLVHADNGTAGTLIAAIEQEVRAAALRETPERRITDGHTSGRWRRVGWHYPTCWQAWLNSGIETGCICFAPDKLAIEAGRVRALLQEAEMDAPEEAHQFLGMRKTWFMEGVRWALGRWGRAIGGEK